MKRLLILIAALFLSMPSFSATYYVSNTGIDTNNGTSTATPWQTVTRVNTFLALASGSGGPNPGDQVLFQRGGVWQDDYIKCLNKPTAASGWTTATHPPLCSGSSSAQLLFGAYGTGANPIIDGANTLSLTWTLVTGTTYQATVGSLPSKLYVDGATSDTPQLLPVPNATGAYNAATTYNPYDLVTNGDAYVRGPITASAGVATNVVYTWLDVTNATSGNSSQSFSTTNTGLQNVEATPGSWYGTGTTIYVNLADGSNPSGHTFEGTMRPYGILLEGVNYVTVQNFTVEHPQHSGIASITYSSDYGTYFTGEYNQIINNNVWNYDGIVVDNLALQAHSNNLDGGILYRTHGQYDPHLVQGAVVQGNRVGTLDQYFGELAGSIVNNQSGIFMAGVDGDLVKSNIVSTKNLSGIHHNTTNLYVSSGNLLNNGGQVVGNYLTNNQGNIYFSATLGGLDAFNVIVNSYGEGIQAGGNSVSTTANPQIHAFNRITHIGKGASQAIYNGIDCNTTGSSASGMYFLNNTVFDTDSANITFEGVGSSGCVNNHVHNNIFDQNTLAFPAFAATNNSYSMYYVNGLGNQNPDFSNNLWMAGTNPNPWHSSVGQYASCSTFMAGWPDKNSVCGSDPLFTNTSTLDLTLQVTSPARGSGLGGVDMGALPYHPPI